MRFLTAAFVLCNAFAASAPAQTAPVERLIRNSWLGAEIPRTSARVIDQFQHDRGALPQRLAAAVTQGAREAYAAPLLRAAIAERLAARMRAEEMDAACAWLESPLGRRVARAESATASVDGKAVQAFAARQKSFPPERARLLREILNAGLAEERAARGMVAMAVGLGLGIDSSQPANTRLGQQRVEAQVRSDLPVEQVKTAMREDMALIFAYAYRGLSDQDLAAYLAFLTGTDGQRYAAETLEAYLDALAQAGLRMGAAVERRAGRQPKASTSRGAGQ